MLVTIERLIRIYCKWELICWSVIFLKFWNFSRIVDCMSIGKDWQKSLIHSCKSARITSNGWWLRWRLVQRHFDEYSFQLFIKCITINQLFLGSAPASAKTGGDNYRFFAYIFRRHIHINGHWWLRLRASNTFYRVSYVDNSCSAQCRWHVHSWIYKRFHQYCLHWSSAALSI